MTTLGLDPGQRTGVAIYRAGKLCERSSANDTVARAKSSVAFVPGPAP